MLVLLAVVGSFFLDYQNYHASYRAVTAGRTELEAIFSGVFVGGAVIFVSYEGFQVIANTVEEMKNPARDVRIGMYISVIVVMITYMSVAWVTIGLVKGEISEAALIQAVEFLGPWAVLLITLGAIASTTSAINATLLGSSRLAYVMSEWRAFPKRLAKISVKTRFPYLAIIITSVLSLSFTFLGDAPQIAEVGSIIFLGIFFNINYAAIKVYPNQKNWTSKIALALIVLDIILAFYYLIVVEGVDRSLFTFIVLTIFVFITLVWMISTQLLYGKEKIDTSAYELEPLGLDLIKEFDHVDVSDVFFLDLKNILIPVAGETYELKNIHLAALISKKYNIHPTLLHVGTSKDKIKSTLAIFDKYGIEYDVIVKEAKGNPARVIIETYKEGDYQLISLSSRRKRDFLSRFERSVSKEVVHNVDCAVLQVHPPRYGQRIMDIQDIFLLLDGTERDAFLVRWAKLLTSVGAKGKVYAYHILELPSIFPIEEAPKVPVIHRSQEKFQKYANELGNRYGMKIIPVFLYGHNFVKALQSATEIHEPDAVLIGRTKDKGFWDKIRTPLSYKIMRKMDATVIIHHMPDKLMQGENEN